IPAAIAHAPAVAIVAVAANSPARHGRPSASPISPSPSTIASGGNIGRIYGISFALASENATNTVAAAIRQKRRAGERSSLRHGIDGISSDHGNNPASDTGT